MVAEMTKLIPILILLLAGCNPQRVPFGGEPKDGMVPICPDWQDSETFNIERCWWE